MAKVFLDTNYFIGIANRTPEADGKILDEHECFLSTLSPHILFYVNKITVPNEKTNDFIQDFNIVDLTQGILEKSLSVPTSDLEDNIQLHSAIEADCDIFLTFDKKLLKMKYFGKMRISSEV